MNEREVDVDALFERDADARLLERRRRDELGLAPQAAVVTTTPIQFGPESIVDTEPPPFRRGALLRASVEARPTAELIPGALVSVVVSVHDDGDADAPDARLRIGLPANAEPVDGSFLRDGIPIDASALLGEGLRLGPVTAGEAVRVRFSLRVLPGTEPLDLAAHAACPGVPSIAAPALRLARRSGHAAVAPPKPFFELEEGEDADDLAMDLALEPLPAAFTARAAIDAISSAPAMPPPPDVAVPPLEAAPPPPDVTAPPLEAAAPPLEADRAPEPATSVFPEPIAAPEALTAPDAEAVEAPEAQAIAATEATAAAAQPEPRVEPAPKEPVSAPPPEAVSEQPPQPVVFSIPWVTIGPSSTPSPAHKPPAPPPEPVEPVRIDATGRRERDTLLARTIEGEEVRALQRVFTGAVPHGLAALALLSSIAAVDSPLGEALGLQAFARTIAAALPRALVAARMGRQPPRVVSRHALDAIRPDGVADEEPFLQSGPLLVTRFDAREREGLRTVLGRDLDDAFLRGVQILLAVCPREIENVPNDVAAAVRTALAEYRVAAGAWLMRTTVRRGVYREHDPLVADDPMLHGTGRALVAALREAAL